MGINLPSGNLVPKGKRRESNEEKKDYSLSKRIDVGRIDLSLDRSVLTISMPTKPAAI
jgi:hypothetical protein